MTTDKQAYTVRQATEADLPTLTDLKSPLALHKDRLRDAGGNRLLYLVIERAGTLVGFGLLVFERPSTWSDANDSSRLPMMVDLFIRADRRSRGAGSYLIARMEETARSRGCSHLYIGVDPIDNERAYQLYLRLGYTPLQTQPYRAPWKFTDSDGNLHEGNDWHIDMVKELRMKTYPPGLQTMLEFPLSQALFGRRSRRFALGSALPEGPLAFTSRHRPLPLTDLEQMVLLAASAGVSGWNYLLKRHGRTGPGLPNYPASAGGRTFPSAAGWQTSELFYTDDNGIYLFETRDAPALVEPDVEGRLDFEALLEAHRSRIRKLSEGRLYLPATEAHIDGHNLWCANQAGSTLLIPVADLAQHLLAVLCYLVQNGSCIYDNVHGEAVPGLERFRHLVDLDNPAPLTEIELAVLTMATAELATCCYAGMLMLQAMGLGGWLYTGLNWLSVLGASGDPEVPGLGFRYDTNPAWAIPNPTGRSGVFEGYCPPHYSDMRAAVEAFAERKFGQGGPFHPGTPGPWKETASVRSSASPYSEEFKDCVALMAQHIYDRFGKFPGTIPSVFTETFLQAHHLDLEFYDHHFGPGAYLWTHARHMADWHPEGPE